MNVVLVMKSKKKSKAKTHSKSKTHKKAKPKTRAPHRMETSPIGPESNPHLRLNTSVKTCQELEVGDIGGFGSPEELEQHQKRCSEPATEFCNNCGRNLCRNHYDMIHRDHDRSTGTANPTSLAQ